MIIIADIGATHMRIAASDASDSFEEAIVLNTPAEGDAGVAAFRDAALRAVHGRSITQGVIGIAGLLSANRQILLRSPHLRGWEGKNVADAFGQALGVPVRFENDVALGALGEARFGAGRGISIVAYIAVGTGVNGARVVDGRIDRTAFGFEIGHQLLGLDANAPEWEALVSGSGLEARYGTPPRDITDPAILNECADNIARGLYNTILLWSPERVVLGGSLSIGVNAIPLERVTTTLRSINKELPELPDIRLAALGDHSGLYGALALNLA